MDFSDSDKKGFDLWISKHLDENHSWEEIENLCVPNDQFDDALEYLVEDQMWPDDLTHERWRVYVSYYKKLHPSVTLSKNQKVVGIDNNGLNNTFAIPYGPASTWEQYRKSLSDSMGPASIIDIEKSCQWVMNHLKEDTTSYGPVKGLVTGSVQSGKTANMAGLISMAADCNWNFFIILSGTIDNLRKQTRDRFKKDLKQSEGILWRVLDFTGNEKNFQESELKLNPLGKKTFANRYVTVCLKNKRRLETLIDWLYDDEKRTPKLRIVLIDDEADQASVNTAEITPEEEQERCAINQLIVNLVNGKKSDGSTPKVSFQAMNYIAYTATPYANVLNEQPGESLYPKDFICTLQESTEYFGAKVIFGNDEKACPELGIVRSIPKADDRELKKIHKGLQYSLPESFKASIAWFLCVSAILRIRPHKKKKSISMLIHTTSIQKQHFHVYDVIRLWLSSNILDVMNECKKIYDQERNTVTVDDLREANPKYGYLEAIDDCFPEFNEIQTEIQSMLFDIRNIMLDDDKKLQFGTGIHLCVDNCKANKEADEGTTLRIVYPLDEQLTAMEKDPIFIVIGGNTLSRGLTIEGLVCTYFSRNSNQADTLMQMARWFGYRKGVELLQRIWMTTSVQKKFEALAKIDMDMKEEIERFMERGISPAMFGPRIRNIPEIKSFRITSKKKSQQAEYDDFDFCGDTYETTDFDNGPILKKNISVTDAFIGKISQTVTAVVSTTTKAYVWRGIDYTIIRDCFLTKYHISEHSYLDNNLPIFCQWIEKMNAENKYKTWNIAVVNGDNHTDEWILGSDICVGKIERTKKKDIEHIDIGSLRSGRDALSDVDEDTLSDEQKDLLAKTLKSGKDIVSMRSQLELDDIPLLLIYRIKKDGGQTKIRRMQLDADYDIIGISIIVSGDSIGGNHAKTIRINIPKQP